jgi:hypothetical protein
MNGDIANAKQQLPLPQLMQRLGLSEHAKRSARCPFHEDRHNSFSISQAPNGLWRWKCFTGCGSGDEIDFIARCKNVSKGEVIKLFLEMAGVAQTRRPSSAQKSDSENLTPIDWQRCIDAFTEKHLRALANWRGLSGSFCSWLHQRGLVGLYNGCIAFPIHADGEVVAAHYRLKDGSWRVFPSDVRMRPLVIGEIAKATIVHAFESQWDGFAVCDKLSLHEKEGVALICTRGAANGKRVAGLIPSQGAVFAWPQNDQPDSNGKRAGEEWLKAVSIYADAAVQVVRTPESFKDVNEWILAGATPNEIQHRITNAQPAPRPDPRAGSALNSLISPILSCEVLEEYPSPLAPAAFNGLAGEVVRRIEPHTEADPAALLFQLLAGFGNLVGHDTYIVADGARHHLNLYGVLVGQSSKSRKGTSWNHVANLLERVAPDWKKNCVTSGLSSGEGLIWEVRDPIEETKARRGRKKGDPFVYETFIADQGETDKRRLVLEAEFASVLKVMRREGNNLSPVIRAAWDSGELNTMVKNCPAKATGAHISIIGHITREELRRLLTETESANGFANRFCWLAVRRSKFLPEGGAIESVNFNDVIISLKQAADSANDFLEVRRDPEAAELWRAAYPALSEPGPGMGGAVTSRGEAQVMRLSAIYALLDSSRLIRVEHHEAAMALWDYCRQSAKWIFGTSTGDRNADKILRALRHAPNGLTKTEISAEVFNRHASSADIDEALRLLHGLKMAYYEIEATNGAPVQRWFACESAK